MDSKLRKSWKRISTVAWQRRDDFQRLLMKGRHAASIIRSGPEGIEAVHPTQFPDPERITSDRSAHEQLLYFTTNGLSADQKKLVFLSLRSGNPNLFQLDLQTREEHQVSQNAEGMLKSYVYFDGNPYSGLGIGSVCMHRQSQTIYYIQGRDACKVQDGGKLEILARLPERQMTAYTAVSADGSRLCIPTVDEQALDGSQKLRGRPQYGIDKRIRDEKLCSYLHIYDTDTGHEVAREVIQGAWITHVQFSPIDNRLVLYNHEWAAKAGIRRMWLWDGLQHTRLRNEEGSRQASDWICHEIWSRDGDYVFYHGRHKGGGDFIGRLAWQSSDITELSLPVGWNQYGHYNIIGADSLVTDGYYRLPRGNFLSTCPWLTRVDVNWAEGRMIWSPLALHLSSWKTQDAHPHPVTDYTGDHVYFTSDRDGKRAVYRVKSKPGDRI